MSRIAASVVVLALLSALALLTPALRAQEPPADRANLQVDAAEIGQQVALTIEVLTPPDASVEVDPAADGWGPIEVVRIESQEERPEGDAVRHLIRVIIAPFATGTLEFTPTVNVITGVDSERRTLPVQQLSILETLGPDDPLELSPLPPPGGIAGAQSPLLIPAVVSGIVLGVVLFGVLTFFVARAIIRRPRSTPEAESGPPPSPDLSYASALLDSDPVTAYRTLAAAVRRHLADSYDIPAVALTARELEQRMESRGMDRFQARLVGGLLENCDAVVYAGYRPAPERRRADLTMAREIVEEPA